MSWKQQFTLFEPALISLIEREATAKKFQANEVIMRTGQYIKSTILVLEGRIKVYRENQDGGNVLPGSGTILCYFHVMYVAISNK